MRLLRNLITFFGESRKQDEITSMLKEAIEIIADYGDILEVTSKNNQSVHPESLLRHTKAQILAASNLLQKAVQDTEGQERLKVVLTKTQFDHILSDHFQEQLKTSLIFLDNFISDEEAAQKQAEWQQTLEMAKALSKVQITRP